MHLMYTLDAQGKRVYTLRKTVSSSADAADAAVAKSIMTKSAHPARFSPDDKFSKHRVSVKKRFGILPTQLPAKPL
ncbi:unnamed protein product [Jaminaea pallidilutea]